MPNLTISHGTQLIQLDKFAVLSPDYSTRLLFLSRLASDVNLPQDSREAWHSILCERSLDDDEADKFIKDLSETPTDVARSIRGALNNRTVKVNVSSLVPRSRRYYERLVGSYDKSTCIRGYATRMGRQFLEQLSSWQPYDGFLFSLLLSWHPSLTAEIRVEHLESNDLERAYSFLGEYGDRLSQLGAIEVGIRILPDRPEIKPALVRLVRQIRDDDAESSASGFKLLSASFLLVDGELSRTRLLSDQPPFFRRLAALSQAALICRQIGNARDAVDSFCEWVAASGRGGRHYLQSLADMRLEPRWYPNFSEALQIKTNFCGRIVIAASECEQSILGNELHDLILGEDPGSIHSLGEGSRMFLPGPLEGTESSFYIMPAELSEAIRAQLSREEVRLSSFTALLNSVPIFHADIDQEELAAKIRALGNTLFTDVEDKLQLFCFLLGLASVAAVTRNLSLADELRILARKCRRDTQYKLSVEEILGITLVAAASRENVNSWIEFVGNCLTELAFGELENDDWKTLYSHLQVLCHAVPELWTSCSRAEAALKALGGYRG